MRIIKLAMLELRRYQRGRLARGAVLAIVLLPLLYGTVYLVAFWNPYKDLSSLPVALVNEDRPVQAQGRTVDAGKQLQQTLTSGADFAWSAVDRSQASQGLANGKYYFELRIPQNFSSSIASLGTTKPTQAKLEIVTNDANNYIVSLIAEQAGARIVTGVSENVIKEFVDTSLSGIVTIRQNLAKAVSGSAELAQGVDELKSKTEPLPAGTAQLAAGNTELARIGDVTRGYAREAEQVAADLVQRQREFVKKHPDNELAKLILDGLIDIRQQLDVTAGKIIDGTRQVDRLAAGSRELASAAKELVAGIRKLDNGANQLSAGLAQGFEQIPNWTNAQVGDIALHVADPVGVTQIEENNPGSYGAGFAPYFLSMALWVGLLVVFMLLKPLPMRVLMAGGISSWGATAVGYFSVMVLSGAQVLVLLAVVRFALGINPVGGWAIVGFMLLVAAVYAAILQLLNAALGSAGRLVALVLLMLQLTSSAGTYPIETSPPFFQAISPFLPMTYVVRGIRHLIGGGSTEVVLSSVGTLIIFGAGAFLLSVFVASRRRRVRMDDLKPQLAL